MPTSKKESEGGEMFSLDENGNRTDAHLHYEILDNPFADAAIDGGYVKRRSIASSRCLQPRERI
jgi:hypothetical protein